jgi:hypothetical protein
MKKVISIQHDTYMMTIHQVVQAIEELTGVKVVKITDDNGQLTFTLQEPEPIRYEEPICKMCGGDWSLKDEGYCSRCWVIWNG